jgi:uncharacterized membrane protein YphA (DoxX/SURF4 family)
MTTKLKIKSSLLLTGQILLATEFIMVGIVKLTDSPVEVLQYFPWTEDFSSIQIILISIAELCGGVGILFPMLHKKIRFLVPVAALELTILMIGATYVQLGRGEKYIFPIMAAIVAFLIFLGYKKILKIK